MTKSEISALTYQITGCAIEVHKALGPGLLESVYEKCLKHELELNGLDVEQQLGLKINYRGLEVDSDLRLDLLVNNLIVVELKTVEKILPIHEAQILSYINLLKKPKGLLINFKTRSITKSMKSFVNEHYANLE